MSAPQPNVPGRLSVAEFDDWRRRGVPHQLVDVREPHEIAICALPDALVIPLGTLPERLGEIATDRPVIVMCHLGGRSQRAVNFLASRGIEGALNLTGGIDAWAKEIEVGMPTY